MASAFGGRGERARDTVMDAPLLEVVGLGKVYPGRSTRGADLAVLAEMSFSVQEGELVTVVGPSGAGKSTLLNLLAQTERPTSGVIKFRGETISSADTPHLEPGWRCQIGYVTQQDNLLPWRRLEENVLFPLLVQGKLTDAARARVDDLIAAIGLKGFERFYPHELSGGMRKRVTLARTLVYDPPIILMDEPFGAVDAQTREQLHEDLLKLWLAKKKTIIFVTHDIGEAITLADRVLVLSRAPSSVAAEYAVDLPRPRSIARSLKEPGFAALYERIHGHLA